MSFDLEGERFGIAELDYPPDAPAAFSAPEGVLLLGTGWFVDLTGSEPPPSDLAVAEGALAGDAVTTGLITARTILDGALAGEAWAVGLLLLAAVNDGAIAGDSYMPLVAKLSPLPLALSLADSVALSMPLTG